MASLLNLVYSVVILLVAIAGVAFVLWQGESVQERSGQQWLGPFIALVVIVYLAAMIGGLVT